MATALTADAPTDSLDAFRAEARDEDVYFGADPTNLDERYGYAIQAKLEDGTTNVDAEIKRQRLYLGFVPWGTNQQPISAPFVNLILDSGDNWTTDAGDNVIQFV